ncbi:MAG TPA: hypothetical protein VLK22_04605 [Candidatus Udaeobacter sp.]|nr:hypothetical protein [Candidatus Udaeobacter sp.]
MEITISKLEQFVGGQVKITKPADPGSSVGCGEIEKVRLENGWVILGLAWYVTKPVGASDKQFCAEHRNEVIISAKAFAGEITDHGLKFFEEDSGTFTVLRPPGHPTLVDGTKLRAFPVPEQT